jgi:hypothetical protein
VAEKDITQKILESYNDVFADIVNVLLFDGEQVIHPDELEDQAPRSAYKADGRVRELERDVAKRWTKNSIRIACVGLENQSEPDAAMPLRVIGYDGAEYRAQLTRENHASPLYPVVTLVLYFGHTKHWDKPLTLHEAVGVTDRFRPFVSDYQINLFEIAWLDRTKVEKFRSDFRIVADYFVQMRENREYTPSRDKLDHVQETLQLLSVMTGDHRFEDGFSEEDGGQGGAQNMCEVLDKIVAKGEARGEARGAEAANLANIRSLMNNLHFDAKQAMDALSIPPDEQKKYAEKL